MPSDSSSQHWPRFTRKLDPDAATLADLRRRYDAREISAVGVARELGLSPTTVAKRLTEWGWRRPAARHAKPRTAGAKKPAAKKTPRRKAAPLELPAPAEGDPALMPAAAKARMLESLFRFRARHVARLDELMAARRVDLDAANRVAHGIFKLNAEIARLEGRSGPAHGQVGDTSDMGAGAALGSDLARLKADLVARLVAAADGREPDTGSGEL
jgi:hypothetical protein